MKFRKELLMALKEDKAWGDVTGRFFIPAEQTACACIKAQQAGVVSGASAAADVFRLRDKRCQTKVRVKDGCAVRKGQVVVETKGPLRSLLSAERTALNVVSHLSGIATMTRLFVQACGRKSVRVLDTRKTLPGLRALQKWGVRCGGGTNHRFDLAETVFIKENHLSLVQGEKGLARFFGTIQLAHQKGFRVEMECRDKKEIVWGLLAGADILLLDNFSPVLLRRAVSWIKMFCREKKICVPSLEASGGVNLKSIKQIAQAGVDRISIGCLTHSVTGLDMNMDIMKVRSAKERQVEKGHGYRPNILS